ncbi:MAG: shikimate dehydrogenase, partial [Bacteroidota bacterium]
VGAVNVIKIESDGRLVGYNSDYYGFLQSLGQSLGYNMRNLHSLEGYKALVLGTGGAAKAVESALKALKITYRLVSRSKKNVRALLYENLDEKIIREHQLIINTTPLGMYPHIETCPNLPYQYLNQQHFCYDLIYNPEQTLFLKKAQKQGARTKGGLEMLHLQAEKAWEIWNN